MIKKELFIILLLFLVCLGIESIYAQEDNEGVLKSNVKSESIRNGLVILLGEKIQPPYSFTLEDDRILINNIPFSAAGKSSGEKNRIQITDAVKNESSFIKKCEQKYIEYNDLYGKDKAKEKILKELQTDPIVSRMSFNNDILTINFNSGRKMNIMTDTFLMKDKTVSIDENVKRIKRNEEIERLKSLLQQDWTIALGDNYTMYLPAQATIEIRELTKGINNGSIPATEGLKKISGISGKQKFSEDILKNISSWREK